MSYQCAIVYIYSLHSSHSQWRHWSACYSLFGWPHSSVPYPHNAPLCILCTQSLRGSPASVLEGTLYEGPAGTILYTEVFFTQRSINTPKQVSFIERCPLFWSVHYKRFHCITLCCTLGCLYWLVVLVWHTGWCPIAHRDVGRSHCFYEDHPRYSTLPLATVFVCPSVCYTSVGAPEV